LTHNHFFEELIMVTCQMPNMCKH